MLHHLLHAGLGKERCGGENESGKYGSGTHGLEVLDGKGSERGLVFLVQGIEYRVSGTPYDYRGDAGCLLQL